MPVESVTYIDDFVTTNPVGASDPVSDLDNHIQNMKIAIQATFPNIAAAMTATAAELNILDGATVTVAELNILDGATVTVAELNTLDGFNGVVADFNILSGADAAGVTATEFQYLNGVTSAIQTQLDAKQASDADLTAIAALANTDGNIMVGNGSAWVAESGATARTSLGLGSLATQGSVNNDDWSGADLAIGNGGTGGSTANAARENLGIYAGYCDSSAAAEDVPSGWSIARSSTGVYVVTHNLSLSPTTDLSVAISPASTSGDRYATATLAADTFTVYVNDVSSGSRVDTPFTFVAIDRS